jgi:hypothetical protein
MFPQQEGCDVIDIDEFYQLKDELQPNLKKLIAKVITVLLFC